MIQISKTTANELFSWIGNIEIYLENIQTAVADFFAEESRESRRRMLECITSQRQLWEERPLEAIHTLIQTDGEGKKK